MSDAAAFHCPHCGGELPDPDTGEGATVSFCPSCGRRIEGWKTGFRASIGGANAPAVTPGVEAPTLALAPSPGLLRLALSTQAAAPEEQRAEPQHTERDLPVVSPAKKRGSLLAPLLMVAGAAAFTIVPLVLLEKPHRPPPLVAPPTVVAAVAVDAGARAQPISAPPITVPDAPVVSPPPLVKVEAAPKAPPKPLVAKPAAAKSDVPVAAPKLVPPPTRLVAATPKPGLSTTKGGLPHKAAAKTDSRATDASAQPSGTGMTAEPPALVQGPSEESAPMTPDERHHEDASRADADGVRFVVQAHLPQVQACYGRAFKDVSPGGRVDVAFLIGGNGRATHVRTEANATHSTVLSSCLEQRIAEWQFPRPASGEFELIYPFVFSPGS